MSIEEGFYSKPEWAPKPVELPNTIAEQFLRNELGTDRSPDRIGENDKRWRLYEKEIDVPNVGKVLLRVDYRQANYPDENPPERFDQVRFDYVEASPDEHSRIAEMHWYVEKGKSNNPYPFDFMQVHRYVEPKYRDSKGVGRSLYQQAEAWAQQVADAKGENVVLALSTDQPQTMRWAEALDFTPYPKEREKREEIISHPELFTVIPSEVDSAGQERNEAIERDGKRVRIWFRKILSPREESPVQS